MEDDPASMFYHWWRYFKTLFAHVKGRGGLDKANHFIVANPPNTQARGSAYNELLIKWGVRATVNLCELTSFG